MLLAQAFGLLGQEQASNVSLSEPHGRMRQTIRLEELHKLMSEASKMATTLSQNSHCFIRLPESVFDRLLKLALVPDNCGHRVFLG